MNQQTETEPLPQQSWLDHWHVPKREWRTQCWNIFKIFILLEILI